MQFYAFDYPQDSCVRPHLSPLVRSSGDSALGRFSSGSRGWSGHAAPAARPVPPDSDTVPFGIVTNVRAPDARPSAPAVRAGGTKEEEHTAMPTQTLMPTVLVADSRGGTDRAHLAGAVPPAFCAEPLLYGR